MSSGSSDLWVITTYYNPLRWSSRLDNYRAFRRELQAPLLTVEWDTGGRYMLTTADADALVQVPGGDHMWQKERLLGMALAALPSHVRHVAWLDCDVMFADPGWLERTRGLLATHDVVQPFRQVTYLDQELTRQVTGGGRPPEPPALASAEQRPSFLEVFTALGERTAEMDLGCRFDPAPGTGRYQIMARPAYGHAWAARRDFMARIGWYDRCVLGGGDLFFAYGITGLAAALLENHRSVGWDFYGGEDYRQWAAAIARPGWPRIACGDELLLHLFHGELADRQYRSRIDGLVPFGLDLGRDLAAGPGEPWSWTRDRSELDAYVLAYLENRREDG